MKIRNKLAQLPEDLPGVIVIPATASMMFNFYDPLLIIEVLKEEVGRYPRLWGVVLLHNFMGGEQREPKVMKLGTSTLGSIRVSNRQSYRSSHNHSPRQIRHPQLHLYTR